MMAAEQPSLRTCFRCEAVFHQEIPLHYHQNICLYDLTNSNNPKKRQLIYRHLDMKLESQSKMIFKDILTLK